MTTRGEAIGLDFGTTNSVMAIARSDGVELLRFDGPQGGGEVFRSALCFWQDDAVRGGLAHEAGPWAIAEYLEDPEASRFIQSFKSVAASASFETASIFGKRFRFEELGRIFLDRLKAHAGGRLEVIPRRIVVGRPVEYAGGRPDPALARQRYDAMFAAFGTEVHYVYEPLGAAYGYAAALTEPATILVADFGGGTSDFAVVRVGAPGTVPRCIPLGHAGIGLAGDRFDYRILDRLVLPLLGKGGGYRSFDKVLEIPRGIFADFADWSKLALMRNRRTLEELERLQRTAIEPDAIGRMIAVIRSEQGFALYDAVSQLKRALSSADHASFRFSGGGLEISAEISREDFDAWIADDVARMASTVERAMIAAGLDDDAIDRVFLTGGTSLVPAVRSIFAHRFGEEKLTSGDELTSIAHGLAMIAAEDDPSAWTS